MVYIHDLLDQTEVPHPAVIEDMEREQQPTYVPLRIIPKNNVYVPTDLPLDKPSRGVDISDKFPEIWEDHDSSLGNNVIYIDL